MRTPRVLGPEADESVLAELIARQWLERYGIVAREMWRRERPTIGWRAIYHELKRLEFRGEVRRGYFVRGLSGAQFALPEAVEMLRSSTPDDDAPVVVMSAADPANVFTLPMPQDPARDAFVRPRSRGALLVTIAGVVVMIAERRGERIVVRPDTSDAIVTRAAEALASYVGAAHESRSRCRDDRRSARIGQSLSRRVPRRGIQARNDGLRFYRKP